MVSFQLAINYRGGYWCSAHEGGAHVRIPCETSFFVSKIKLLVKYVLPATVLVIGKLDDMPCLKKLTITFYFIISRNLFFTNTKKKIKIKDVRIIELRNVFKL